LASDAHANEPTFFDRVIAWFNPNKAAPDTSAPDATPYTVTFEIAGSERSVRSAVTDASNLESLKRQAPDQARGTSRRRSGPHPRRALYRGPLCRHGDDHRRRALARRRDHIRRSQRRPSHWP